MQSSYYGQGFKTQRQLWQESWPTGLMGLIATFQMLFTFAILGIETWSMVLSFRMSFLLIGYIASFFYTITWISTYTVACCNRGSQGCATHALVENILSMIASCVLLYYESQFLLYPSTCFWPYSICRLSSWDLSWGAFVGYSIFDIQRYKLIAIKVQLSCAAIMLALSVLFFLIYLYAILNVKSKSRGIQPQGAMELQPQQRTLQPPPNVVLIGQPPSWSNPSYF
ncbi:unnamed protein product [Rotaria sp. Silwood2]|nr:unnamed protein product [Rotaria sp. Silwood2]CAF2610248.1 unnamed protein product [Rotaria sp. Silwood2]CAF2871495.1 unnamed protein product [Rotaria sp. Silwood2]CAF3858886.1 unnamed protein product [Rotaria sp. Silwood2]CAF4087514.1 unnamed protein product [Rotaria sp. Silwood2]